MVQKWGWKRMKAGHIYDPMAMEDLSWKRMQEAQWVFNHSRFWEDKESLDGVRACLGQAPEDLVLTLPIHFDHGDRIFWSVVLRQHRFDHLGRPRSTNWRPGAAWSTCVYLYRKSSPGCGSAVHWFGNSPTSIDWSPGLDWGSSGY
ncbi:hypothetical protein [Streptococcus sp. NLN64]|uniref:hypothetical protein n=1 Tax=Streptococcus sp. NLN64 TaxID=2822799 RepID=UPI0032B41A97